MADRPFTVVPSKKKETSPNNDKRIATALSKINSSSASASVKAEANKKGSGGGGGNILKKAVFKTLDALDTPRAAGTAAIAQVVNAYTLARAGDKQMHENTKLGWNQFWKDTSNNVGVGELFDRAIGDENVIRGKDRGDAYKLFGVGPNVNTKWWKRSIGLAGDLIVAKATLPVPGKALTKAGGKQGITRKLMQSENAADHALGQKIQQGGMKTLTRNEVKRVAEYAPGYTGAVKMRVPLTGGREVTALPQSLTRYTPSGMLDTAKLQGRNLMKGTGVNEALGGSTASLRKMVMHGDSTQARNAFLAMDAVRNARFFTRPMAETLTAETTKLRREVDHSKFNSTDLYHALAMDDEAFAALDPELQRLATKAKGNHELLRMAQNDVVTRVSADGNPVEWVPQRAGWQPTLVTDDMQELLLESGRSGTKKGSTFKPRGFEKRATIVAGGEFRGVPLLEPSEYKKLYGEALTPRQQADKVLDDLAGQFGAKHVRQMFSTDYFESMEAHLREATYRTQHRFVEESLAKSGVFHDRFQAVFDPKLVKQARQASKARGAIWQARFEYKQQQAMARQAELDIADAEKQLAKAEARRAAADEAAANPDRQLKSDVKDAAATRRQEKAGAKGLDAAGDQADTEALSASERATAAILQLDEITAELGPQLDEASEAWVRSLDEYNAAQGQYESALAELNRVRAAAGRAYDTADKEISNLAKRRKRMTEIEDHISDLEDEVATAQAKLVIKGVDPRIHQEYAAIRQKRALLDSPDVVKAQGLIAKFADGSIAEDLGERLNRLEMAVQIGLIPPERDQTVEQLLALVRKHPSKFKEGNITARAKSISAAYQKQRDLVRRQETLLHSQINSADDAAKELIGGLMQRRVSLETARTELKKLMAAGPTDPVAQRAAQVLETMATVSQKGYLFNPMGYQGNWAHGVGWKNDTLDLTRTRDQLTAHQSFTQTLDNFAGSIHLSSDPQFSYRTHASKMTSDVFGNPGVEDQWAGKVAMVRVRSDNPITYGLGRFGDNSVPVGELPLGPPGGPLELIYGSKWGSGIRDMQNDMIKSAFDMNAISLDELRPHAMSDANHWFDDVLAGVNEDLDIYGDSVSTREAILGNLRDNEVFNDFAYRFDDPSWEDGFLETIQRGEQEGMDFTWAFDPDTGQLLPPEYWASLQSEDDYLWSKFVMQLGDSAPDPVRKRIGVAYQADLAARGYDSIVYSMAAENTAWAAIPLHPSQVELNLGYAKEIWGTDIDSALKSLELGELPLPDKKQRLYMAMDMDGGSYWTTNRDAAYIDGSLDENGHPFGPTYADISAGPIRAQELPDGSFGISSEEFDTAVNEYQIRDTRQANTADERVVDMRDLTQEKADDLADIENALARPYVAIMDDIRDERARLIERQTGIMSLNLGMDVEQLAGELAESRQAFQQNSLRLSELQGEFGRRAEPIRAELASARQAELTARTQAKGLYSKAQEIRIQADHAYRERVAALRAQYALDEQTIRNSALIEQDKAAFDEAMATSHAMDIAANALKVDADLRRAGKRVLTVEKSMGKFKDPDSIARIVEVQKDGFSRIGYNRMGPNDIVEALTVSTKTQQPEFVQGVLSTYDKAMHVWKSYALMSPGFHFRNVFGGIFNNRIANLEFKWYGTYMKMASPYFRATRRGATHEEALAAVAKKVKDPQLLRNWDTLIQSGALSAGQSSEVLTTSFKNANINPLSPDNAAAKVNQRVMHNVENFLRGSLALSTLERTGGNLDAMIDDVVKYHFDYDDLSKFERNVARRLIPFYTWTRKNLPLQIEGMLTNPRPYLTFLSAKRNLEYGVDQEEVVPSWFNNTMSTIHTPFSPGGNDLYFMPDLPFTKLNQLEPKDIASQLTPVIKTPLELSRGKSFFSDIPFKEGYVPVPEAWNKMGVGAALAAIGKAKKGADGRYYATDKTLYSAEQAMPLLGRTRRLLPSEEKYQQRSTATWASFVFGIGSRANTEKDKEGELFRRAKEVEAMAKDLKDLQFIPTEDSTTKKKTGSVLR